jgi:hypothetical protein
MKKFLIGAILAGTTGLSFAQDLPQRFVQLPDLPAASTLQSSYIGNHYLLGSGMNKEPVVFSGYNLDGSAIAFSLTDVPERKVTQEAALQMCASKGQGWSLPRIGEIMKLSPYVDDVMVGFLPGNHWTTTNAPCQQDCPAQERFYMTYDPLSRNQGNHYNFGKIYKFYPTCVYRF